MTAWVRALLAAAVWALAAALGWWLQFPASALPANSTSTAAAAPVAAMPDAGADDGAAARITLADPLALRLKLAVPGEPVAEAASSEVVPWRISALVVRDNERFVVLAAPNQTPLRLAQGDRLPDGDLIKAIHPDRVDIESPRRRTRTIRLIEQ